jgi:DNA-binding GntR family transcriptional regulator
MIVNRTRDVGESDAEPLPDYIAAHYELHEHLVDATEARDSGRARQLFPEHNDTAVAGT